MSRITLRLLLLAVLAVLAAASAGGPPTDEALRAEQLNADYGYVCTLALWLYNPADLNRA